MADVIAGGAPVAQEQHGGNRGATLERGEQRGLSGIFAGKGQGQRGGPAAIATHALLPCIRPKQPVTRVKRQGLTGQTKRVGLHPGFGNRQTVAPFLVQGGTPGFDRCAQVDFGHAGG